MSSKDPILEETINYYYRAKNRKETPFPHKKEKTMNLTDAKNALKKYFGYDSFRPRQAEIIQNVFTGRDTLVLMPTGGGKSVCFQIPAVTMPGTAIVVSPLISLMKDQVEGLRANGIRAAFINSSLPYNELRQVEDDLFNGRLDLCYVSPEKIVSREFLPLLKKVNVNLFAIDEAHCISGWGHDFRPEYTQLQFLKKLFPEVPIIALTATADKVTRKDILKQLTIPKAKVFISSFDRPNLSLEVRPGQKRMEQIVSFVKNRPNESGIIYCLSRRSCEQVAAKLLSKGIKADFYHGAMSSTQRSTVQENFINDVTPVVCATIAFGMGIDKSNVRYVIHYNLPRNMEGYYQEIGRAGRDGVDSQTVLFYSFADVMSYRRMYSDEPSQQTELKMAKLDRMYQYATAQVCRRKILLNYFNEHLREDCGNCDICKNPPKLIDATVFAQKALSAVARTKGTVGIALLVNILRGSRAYAVVSAGYDKIKTYGVGADTSFDEWRHIIEQFVHLGYLDIAHDDKNHLKLNEASKEVLFENRKVEIISFESYKKREEESKQKKAKPQSERERVRDGLFDSLRKLRLKIARKQEVPPYVIFSDATLEEMAAMRPTDNAEMMEISGVGQLKMEKYGDDFIRAILGYAKINNIPLSTFKNRNNREVIVPASGPRPARKTETILPGDENLTTTERTIKYFRQGKSADEIAAMRNLNPTTIKGHLVKFYEEGGDIDINKFVSPVEIQMVLDKLPLYHNNEKKLRPVYEALGEKISFEKIKWALAYHEKRMKELPQ